MLFNSIVKFKNSAGNYVIDLHEVEFIGTNSEELKLVIVTKSNDITIEYTEDGLEALIEEFNDLHTKLKNYKTELAQHFYSGE